jgi:hypothetical protein
MTYKYYLGAAILTAVTLKGIYSDKCPFFKPKRPPPPPPLDPEIRQAMKEIQDSLIGRN